MSQADALANEIVDKHEELIRDNVEQARGNCKDSSIILRMPLWIATKRAIMKFMHVPIAALLGWLEAKLGPVIYTVVRAILDNEDVSEYAAALSQTHIKIQQRKAWEKMP